MKNAAKIAPSHAKKRAVFSKEPEFSTFFSFRRNPCPLGFGASQAALSGAVFAMASGERNVTLVISDVLPKRMGGPQKPVPSLM